MAIKTRPTEDEQASVTAVERLTEILEKVTAGAISANANALIPMPTDLDGLLDLVKNVFEVQQRAGQQLFADLAVCAHDNMIMSIRLTECLDVLDKFMDVSYDEAMDHASIDLMDAFTSSGAAEVSANGDLSFDEKVVLTKADIKPILREAIRGWVEAKLQ